MRAARSALGIAIGVASIVAVLGLSASSRAGLLAELDRLGDHGVNSWIRARRLLAQRRSSSSSGSSPYVQRAPHAYA
jgi:ABC-type antimicrobial peptide transport system permease subunit